MILILMVMVMVVVVVFSVYIRKVDDDSGNAIFKSGDSKNYGGDDIVVVK